MKWRQYCKRLSIRRLRHRDLIIPVGFSFLHEIVIIDVYWIKFTSNVWIKHLCHSPFLWNQLIPQLKDQKQKPVAGPNVVMLFIYFYLYKSYKNLEKCCLDKSQTEKTSTQLFIAPLICSVRLTFYHSNKTTALLF